MLIRMKLVGRIGVGKIWIRRRFRRLIVLFGRLWKVFNILQKLRKKTRPELPQLHPDRDWRWRGRGWRGWWGWCWCWWSWSRVTSVGRLGETPAVDQRGGTLTTLAHSQQDTVSYILSSLIKKSHMYAFYDKFRVSEGTSWTPGASLELV